MNREAIMNCGAAAVLIRHQYHTTQKGVRPFAADSWSNEGSGVGRYFLTGAGFLMSQAWLASGRNDWIV
jgi:hypothetical protein